MNCCVWAGNAFLPFRVLLLTDATRASCNLPLLSIMRHKQGRTTGYICENYICILPTSGEAVGLKQRH